MFLDLKNHLGDQRHCDDDSVKTSVLQWLAHLAANFYDKGIKMEEIMWESRLKCGLLCKNKIVTIFLLVFYTSKRYLGLLKKTRLVYISNIIIKFIWIIPLGNGRCESAELDSDNRICSICSKSTCNSMYGAQVVTMTSREGHSTRKNSGRIPRSPWKQ